MSSLTPGFYRINNVFTEFYLLSTKNVVPNTDLITQKGVPAPDESTFIIRKLDGGLFSIIGQNNETYLGPGDDGKVQWQLEKYGWELTAGPAGDDYNVGVPSEDLYWYDDRNALKNILIQGMGIDVQKYLFRFSKLAD